MELAAIKADKEIFLEATNKTYYFHLTQAIFRKVTEEKLKPTYRWVDFKYLIKSLLSLSFLPAKDIASAYDNIKEEIEVNKIILLINLSLPISVEKKKKLMKL